MDNRDLLVKITNVLRSAVDPPSCAWLFGSRARGEATAASDVDVAALFATDPPNTFEGLHLDLQGVLELACDGPVDLIVMNHAPVDLAHGIMREGILLYDDNPSRRIAFETRARREYFDLLPYLREYRRAPGYATS